MVKRGSTVILDGINWHINHGEHWAVLGANGSGKTTLLNSITAYLSPVKGEIKVAGQQFGKTDWREVRKKIGMVTSRMREHIPNDEPVLEVIISGIHAMLGYWGDLDENDIAKAEGLIETLGLQNLRDKVWGMLSQGERQKVLIARALIPEPVLLILDEVCAGLDPIARESFLEMLPRLVDGDRAPTLVSVTHHIEEISEAFTHALLLREGSILASGPVDEIITSDKLTSLYGKEVHAHQHEGRRYLTFAP